MSMNECRTITLIIFLCPSVQASDCIAGVREFPVTAVSDSEITGALPSVRADAMLLLPGVNMGEVMAASHIGGIVRVSFACVKAVHANADTRTGTGGITGSHGSQEEINPIRSTGVCRWQVTMSYIPRSSWKGTS